MIQLDETVTSFSGSTSREWLETNGIGGYASSTISGANTRRYQGLLVAATKPPLGRAVLLSKFEECVVVEGRRFELSTNQYPGIISPDGYKYLSSFRLDPFPIWTYDIAGLKLEKKLFMIHGSNATVMSWSVISSSPPADVTLELKPLIACRDFHGLQHQNAAFNTASESTAVSVTMQPTHDLPPIVISHTGAQIATEGYWYRNFEYDIERERGFDFREDLYQPYCLTFDLAAPASLIVGTSTMDAADIPLFERAEVQRRADLIDAAAAADDAAKQLVLAADQFLVRRGSGRTVIAGYHWFSDWGRDTMIALPGLTLATGRPEIAKSIILEFAKHISQGMLPNRFPDEGEEPDYNTVDATLWYFEAIRAYAEATGDDEFIRDSLFDSLVDIIDWHIRGTRYNIHVDTDGLLFAGEPGVQLTWMDAKIGDWVVTPRTGKPVEIQALWYNALRIMAEFASRFGIAEKAAEYASMADIAGRSFNGQFWNADEECLFDVVNGSERDASIRPNQIFAVSLRHTMLDEQRAEKVLQKVESGLLTPVGLRSLSPADPRYAPIYIGSPLERDSSYHQGTVWGWLIGPYIDACRRVRRADVGHTDLLAGFRAHLSDGMIGQIAEIFDADPPHSPRGAAAQAWSVAEVLRTLSRSSDSRS